MDYSNLNNFLQKLEIEQKNNETILNERVTNNNLNVYSRNDLYTDNKNKDVMLQRELCLNNQPKFNFQVANPQRVFTEKTNNNNNNYSQEISNYRFNNNMIERNQGDNRLLFSNNTNVNKKNINNFNNRELMPTKSNFNISYKHEN